jgi:hypothetical protein
MRRALLPAIAGLSLISGVAGGQAVKTDTVVSQVERAVEAQHGWKSDEVLIQEVAQIRMPPCGFFSVSHKTLRMHDALQYAVLGDGRVLSLKDKDAAAQILSACGAGTKPSADAWAEVVARFHPGLGGIGSVVYDRTQAQIAVGRLEAAGKSFAPPSLTSSGGKVQVQFYLMNYETGILYLVTAVRGSDGALSVEKAKAA